MNNENFGLSRRSDSAWKLAQMKQHNPDEYDALIEADLEVMKQPIFDSPYDQYDSLDDIQTDYPTAHSQLLANLSGDDTNPNDIWALAEGDYSALERLPEDKRDTAFRICDRMEESGNWKPNVPAFDPTHSYKISRLGDGNLGLSQGGHVFHTADDYDGISTWLGENDPAWLPESGEIPTGLDATQFFNKLSPWDEIDDNCYLQNPFNRDFDDFILSNPFGNSDDDDDTGYAIVEFPDF
jgi:hypothetical protein